MKKSVIFYQRRVLKAVFFVGTAALALVPLSYGGGTVQRNPPECDRNSEDCGCESGGDVSSACIKVNLELGVTTPWSGALSCALKVFADSDSPNVFSQDSLYAVLGGYTFKRIGQKNLSDGVTPAEVVLAHPNGEPVHFVFKDGESIARPDPGVHIKMDERLMMVDAEGWATIKEPVYYDLYVGDGSCRRFLATNMTGALGRLVSITDARGVTVTPNNMGIDIIYDSNGVRQFLTPSRLADVTPFPEFKGYEVRIYALQDAPSKDPSSGLYVPPQTAPVKHLQIRPENGWRRATVTLRSGDDEPKLYVFDYVFGDWSLTHSSGMEERKEREVYDGRAAYIKNETVAPDGKVVARKVKNYSYESWGYALTNRVEGLDDITDITEWTYYTSGNGKGQVKTERRQSGLLIEYSYDSVDRVISKKRSGPGMMTEVTTFSYTPVDASDPILAVDTRPRAAVKTLNGIECERTYYVYSPLTNIVERVGEQGAAYGGTNALRTVTEYYPVVVADLRSGFVKSVRHENGKIDAYDYFIESSNCWIRMVTHVHEQSPTPVSGKTTRDITVTNARGEVIEMRTEAFVENAWLTIARERMTYNMEGKRIKSENLAGQVTTTTWDCCHKISEVQFDGSTTTWDYDEEGRMIASSRLIPLDMTNIAWLTTYYEYDLLGHQTATWQTNLTANVGLPATRMRYDALGRVVSRVDQIGNATTTAYSPDGRTVAIKNPNTSTSIVTRSSVGDMLSIAGTAVTPEFHAYGILPDGIRWKQSVRGETIFSPRFAKHYENMLGQVVREERSGFNGASLATTHTYDSLGRLVSTVADYEPAIEYTYDTIGERIATTRVVEARSPSASLSVDSEWRRTETQSYFGMDAGCVWLIQTNIVSCSDITISPLVTSSSRQLTGLNTELFSRSRIIDVRGNVTENEMFVDSSIVTSCQTVPYATNKQLTISRYGVELQTISVSAVTNTVAYDFLGRQIAQTDGRGNTTRIDYNDLGQRSASIDALGNRTAYTYDQFGSLASVINPLGNATVYEYDIRGRKTYEGGATYPVRYTYDIFGNKTTMTTYRNEAKGVDSGDVTRWLYDEASGCMTNKIYADGKGPVYDYALDGKLSQRIWARGVVTDYSYDSWGNLTNTAYSDGTPSVSVVYDVMNRQIQARDAAGVTAFAYDAFGSVTNETVIGIAWTNTIIRHWDSYGRSIGYSLVGFVGDNAPQRQSTLSYDPVTGRLAAMLVNGLTNAFRWTYLDGSDLKSQLLYPNGLTASWHYDANNHLLQVCNAFPTNVISQFDYTYDAVGRRVRIGRSGFAMPEYRVDEYGYNVRSELILASKNEDGSKEIEYQYHYDDIGNRISSLDLGTNRTYTANNLNQYTSISNSEFFAASAAEFTPQFDEDGNQTLIKTATGIWQISYNGENRPVSWQCITPNSSTPPLISMSYDRMGRRVTKNNQRFVYDEYLQIANFEQVATNSQHTTYNSQLFIWDPTELVATRPIACDSDNYTSFYTHDGNKNVSEMIKLDGIITAHYKYTPFGAVAEQYGDYATANPWRFSCEYYDDVLGLVYYNYRYYNSHDGRWMNYDCFDSNLLYLYLCNSPNTVDLLGCVSNSDIQNATDIFLSKLQMFNQIMGRATICMKELHGWATNPLKSGGSNDKYAHCLASCELSGSNSCGPILSMAAGMAKEMGDIIALIPGYIVNKAGFSEFSEKVDAFLNATSLLDSYEDIQADITGIGCNSSRFSCECCCKENYSP